MVMLKDFQKINQSQYNNEYEFPSLNINDVVKYHEKIQIKHKICGYTSEKSYYKFKTRNCGNCAKNKKHTQSYWKKKVIKFLGKEYIILDTENNKHLSRHSVINLFHKKCNNYWDPTIGNILFNGKCKFCSSNNKFTFDEVKKIVENDTSNEYSLISDDYINNKTNLVIRHNSCHNVFKMSLTSFYNGKERCPFCSNSKGENLIIEILKKNNIKFDYQVSYDKLKYIRKLKFDFRIFVSDKNYFLLEFDGKQHYFVTGYTTEKVLHDNQHRDNIKNNFCLNNSIHLYRIKYTLIDNLENIILYIFKNYVQRLSKRDSYVTEIYDENLVEYTENGGNMENSNILN